MFKCNDYESKVIDHCLFFNFPLTIIKNAEQTDIISQGDFINMKSSTMCQLNLLVCF